MQPTPVQANEITNRVIKPLVDSALIQIEAYMANPSEDDRRIRLLNFLSVNDTPAFKYGLANRALKTVPIPWVVLEDSNIANPVQAKTTWEEIKSKNGPAAREQIIQLFQQEQIGRQAEEEAIDDDLFPLEEERVTAQEDDGNEFFDNRRNVAQIAKPMVLVNPYDYARQRFADNQLRVALAVSGVSWTNPELKLPLLDQKRPTVTGFPVVVKQKGANGLDVTRGDMAYVAVGQMPVVLHIDHKDQFISYPATKSRKVPFYSNCAAYGISPTDIDLSLTHVPKVGDGYYISFLIPPKVNTVQGISYGLALHAAYIGLPCVAYTGTDAFQTDSTFKISEQDLAFKLQVCVEMNMPLLALTVQLPLTPDRRELALSIDKKFFHASQVLMGNKRPADIIGVCGWSLSELLIYITANFLRVSSYTLAEKPLDKTEVNQWSKDQIIERIKLTPSASLRLGSNFESKIRAGDLNVLEAAKALLTSAAVMSGIGSGQPQQTSQKASVVDEIRKLAASLQPSVESKAAAMYSSGNDELVKMAPQLQNLLLQYENMSHNTNKSVKALQDTLTRLQYIDKLVPAGPAPTSGRYSMTFRVADL